MVRSRRIAVDADPLDAQRAGLPPTRSQLPADRKEGIARCVRQLPALYTQYRQTNESRYGEQIARLVQEVLKSLEGCPEASRLDADFRGWGVFRM